MDFDKNLTVSEESELLINKLREHPVLAKLVDYALSCGITFLVHPHSQEMIKKRTVTWAFCNFSFFSEENFFIFVPFDKEKLIIFPEAEAHQIFCLAHELGHFKLQDSRFGCANSVNCPIWITRLDKNWQDNCLLKEVLANIQAVKIMKKVAKVALSCHAFQIILTNLWMQCSACLKGINNGTCPQRRLIARALRALAKAVNSAQKEISRQMMETKNRPN